MAANIGFATLSVIPSTRGFSQHMRSQLANVMPQAGQDAGAAWGSGFDQRVKDDLASLGGVIKKTGIGAAGAIAGIGAAVTGLALKGGIDRALNIEDAEAKLRGLGHSAEGIETIMDSALASVKGTAFGLGDAATIAASAVASGIEPGEQLTEALKAVADAATIAGIPLIEMGAIFNKVQANGRMMTLEMNQLQDRGIPILTWLQEAFGATAEEMRQMVTQGQVDAETFRKVIQDNIGGAALESGETFRGAMSNVGAALSRLGEAVVSPLLGAGRDAFGGLIEGIDELTSRVKPAMERFVNSDFWATLQGHIERIPEYMDSAIESFMSFWETTEIVRTGVSEAISGLVALVESNMGKAVIAVGGLKLALDALKRHPLLFLVTGVGAVAGRVEGHAETIAGFVDPVLERIERLNAVAREDVFRHMFPAEDVATLERHLERGGSSLTELMTTVEGFDHAMTMMGRGGTDRSGVVWEELGNQIDLQSERIREALGGNEAAFVEQGLFVQRWAQEILTGGIFRVAEGFVSVPGVAHQMSQDTAAELEALQTAAAERFENILGSVQSFITGLEELPDAADTTTGEFLSNLEERNSELETWFDNLEILASAGLGDLVQFAIDEGPEKMRELVASWAGDIPTAQNTNDMLAAGQELAEKGTQDLLGAEAIANLIRAGRETVEGYARGIDIHTYIAAASARRMANAATRAASSELEVQSPSKVFERIGAFVPAGLADGIEKNLDPVRRAANLMVEASIPDGGALQRRLGGLTPRIDPVDVEAQAAISYQARLREAEVTAGSGAMGNLTLDIDVHNPIGEPTEETLQSAPLAYAIQGALRGPR